MARPLPLSLLEAAVRSKRGVVLLLDFDGVLAPIVKRPDAAHITARTKRLLALCARLMPVAVISGRELKNVKHRVAVPEISYAGSHGLEWLVGGKRRHVAIPAHVRAELRRASRALQPITRRYPGIIRERKAYSYALNLRALSPSKRDAFLRAARRAVAPHIAKGHLVYTDDMGTFEIKPAIGWTKGECALELYHKLRRSRSAVPIYIGDSKTDEDAFRALRRIGLTVLVGGRKKTAAKYRIHKREQVDVVLLALAKAAATR